jgi:DNA mismatch endonuclease, patch repair protein
VKESVEDRSRIMRAVKSRDTGPELAVRRLLHAMGYRFRLHRSDLPGKPDIVLPGRQKVIFVHGCFWHGHSCARGAREPLNNASYWRAKIERNRTRDSACLLQLRAIGWKTLVIWECQLKGEARIKTRLRRFLR